MIDAHLNVRIDQPSRYAGTGSRRAPVYDKRFFAAKLAELGTANEIAGLILDVLPPHFTCDQLDAAVLDLDRRGVDRSLSCQTVSTIRSLAASNYELVFPGESELAERVIYPAGPNESRGMEDACFVRFTHDDGSVNYYATYTAFDGFQILPQLIETQDFLSFRIATLDGKCSQNKGMALFPRMIGGRYGALSRHDNENNFLMLSDEVRSWHETERIQIPCRPWELVQIGNCGSSLETEAGWLVITHGVGPLRQFRTGKQLAEGRRILTVAFKQPPLALFERASVPVHDMQANHLTFDLADNGSISASFLAKRPGPDIQLSDARMEFHYGDDPTAGVLEAYERLIHDALIGDHTLFTRSDGASASGRSSPPCSTTRRRCRPTRRARGGRSPRWPA